MFDPKYPRGTYPNGAAMKPQHVLITRNGDVRTSHVTVPKIMEAVYEIGANEYVTLEKCRPVRIVREAECFAMSFYKDSRISVYFRVRKTMLRMVRRGFSCEAAADMMCDFFQSAVLPDMSGWMCEELTPAPRKSESSLSVNGEDFRHFGCADVVAALENIIEGKSKWMLHDFTGDDGGYINIHRYDKEGEAPRYKVECVKWTEPTPEGYRCVVTDVASLRRWLWDFTTERKFPDPTPEWESFDVNDTFGRLVFRFLDKEDKLNNDEG